MTTVLGGGDGIAVSAPAKINLTLCVRGRRADGYHLLESLVVFAGVGDRIMARRAPKLALKIHGPFASSLADAPDNLVLRAARLLAARAGVPAAADITLEKNLPVASGIGGGSSDAAATLRACARLWGVDLGALSDSIVAADLGADVPVCLYGKPAFMSGIGDTVAPAPGLPVAWFVLVNPGRPLATKSVFNALNGRFSSTPQPSVTGLRDARALADALKACGNDLMAPARELLPAIGDVLNTLENTRGCLLARLSGSGPTCFGIFPDETAARSATAALAQQHPAWWSAAAPLLTIDGADQLDLSPAPALVS